jgi:hypothetical protein
LRDIEKEIGKKIPVDRNHSFHLTMAEDETLRLANTPKSSKGSRRSLQSRTDYRSDKRNSSSTARSDKVAEPQRKRSISGKVKKVKSSTKKSYGYSFAKPKSGNTGPKKRRS